MLFFIIGLLWISKAFSLGQAHHTSCPRMLTNLQTKKSYFQQKKIIKEHILFSIIKVRTNLTNYKINSRPSSH